MKNIIQQFKLAQMNKLFIATIAFGCNIFPFNIQQVSAQSFNIIDSKGDTFVVKNLSMKYESGGMFVRTEVTNNISFKKGEIVIDIPVERIKHIEIEVKNYVFHSKIEMIDSNTEELELKSGTLMGTIELAGQPTPFHVWLGSLKSISRRD